MQLHHYVLPLLLGASAMHAHAIHNPNSPLCNGEEQHGELMITCGNPDNKIFGGEKLVATSIRDPKLKEEWILDLKKKPVYQWELGMGDGMCFKILKVNGKIPTGPIVQVELRLPQNLVQGQTEDASVQATYETYHDNGPMMPNTGSTALSYGKLTLIGG